MIFQSQIIGKPLPTLTNPGTAADLLSGKQLIDANGNVLTGTMANRGAQSLVLEQGDSYTIPAGYHNGSGTISVRKPIALIETFDSSVISDPKNFSITIPSQYTIISDDIRECMLSVTFRGRGKYSSYPETNISAGLLPNEYEYNHNVLTGYISTAFEYGSYGGSYEMKVTISGNVLQFKEFTGDVTLIRIDYFKVCLLVYEN